MDRLAIRLIHDIEAEFQKRRPILDFGVLPSEDLINSSPVVYIDGHLALRSWCVPTLYNYVYKRVMDFRKLNNSKSGSITSKEIGPLSRILLLLNPDVSTVWNMRKELLVDEGFHIFEDFQLTELVLTRKPKISDAFMHRRWLLRHLLTSLQIDCEMQLIESHIESELRVCTMAATRYPNNYVAWNHREWIHETFGSYNSQMLHNDLSWSKEWVTVHISDHSGFQFRQFLLKKMKTDEDMQLDTALHSERDMTRELLCFYPGHEALWYHYKFVLFMIMKQHISVGGFMDEECTVGISNEMEFIDQCTNCNLDNNWHLELASRFKRWLSSIAKK